MALTAQNIDVKLFPIFEMNQKYYLFNRGNEAKRFVDQRAQVEKLMFLAASARSTCDAIRE